MSDQNEHPEIAEVDWIDDAFHVVETRWKTWKSFHKDGRTLVMSLHQDTCINATRFYLKEYQDNNIKP